MKANAIVIANDKVSNFGYSRLIESSESVKNDFTIEKFNAVTPTQVKDNMLKYGLKWNYPWSGSVTDFASGLIKSAYQTQTPGARIGCALSHYILWSECAAGEEPHLILEHDAYFIKKLDVDIKSTKFNILGINNPLGCTRKSREYYQTIMNNPEEYQFIPWIDKQQVPQGLAGNSAYIVTPAGAARLIDLVHEFGLWPNDAIMCRQLVLKLGVTRTFYTHIQNLKSTTTL
mgnify:CR=1 FL=1